MNEDNFKSAQVLADIAGQLLGFKKVLMDYDINPDKAKHIGYGLGNLAEIVSGALNLMINQSNSIEGIEMYNKGLDSALIEIYEKKRIYESIHRAHHNLPMWELFFDEITLKINNQKIK